MNELMNTKILTMSSREISDLVWQRHDNVKRTIETLSEKGVISLPHFEEVINPSSGPKMIGVYNLAKRDSLIVVAQLCPELTANIIDRWQELEASMKVAALPDFTDPVAAARAWADAKEAEKIALDQLELAKPAVEFVDRYVLAESAKGIREVAKVLGIKQNTFVQMLLDNKVLYRQSGQLLPFAKWQDKDYFTVKTGEKHGHIITQTRFTPAGIEWVAKMVRTQGA